MTRASLAVLGTFELAIDGKVVDRFRTSRVQALLVYLAVEAGRGARVQRRENLIELLWPGMPTSSGLQNLRQTLYQLKKQVPDVSGQSFLLSNRQTIQINPDYLLTVDTAEMVRLLAHHPDHWLPAVDLYRGDFLNDFYLSDAATFELWSANYRADYRRRVLDALVSLTDMQIDRRAYKEAERLAHRQLQIDSLRERAYQQLMTALSYDGRRAEALRQYEMCRQALDDELGVPVSEATVKLAEMIRREQLPIFGRTEATLGAYDLKEMIGSGNFGSVYRGVQTSIGREVAVKIIRDKYANDPDFIRRFEAEAQIVARLEHPHIVPLYDFWREPGSAYLVMRWLRGGSLADQLNGGWSVARAVPLVQQVAQALQVAHDRGIVHRDIKPANILLDEAGNGYLSDFGIALVTDAVTKSLAPAEMLLSSSSMSPEQLNDQPLTAQSDIYSLGVTLYELLTGDAPFAGESPLQRAYLHMHQPLPSLLDSHPSLPVALDAVVQIATAKLPQERYQTVTAFADALLRSTSNGATSFVAHDTGRSDTDNPYKGLQAFGEADAGLFFGRRELIKHLADKIASDNFIALVGPSGSGKSSVVRAGLIPDLRAGGVTGSQDWFITDMLPGTHPFEELEHALLRVAVGDTNALLTQLKDGDRGLVRAVKRVLPAGTQKQLLLVIDQFEELFTLVEDSAVRHHFLRVLQEAINDQRTPIRVLVTLRADFYDRPLSIEGFSELMRQYTEVITPLNSAELTAAIRQPAALAGVSVEPDLITTLVSDVKQQPGALPLLQYTLTELFEQRSADTLTLAAYNELGGILGALASRADEIYQSLTSEQQVACKQLFLRLVTLGEGVEDTRRRVLQSELDSLFTTGQQATNGDNNSQFKIDRSPFTILTAFGNARLLSFDHDPSSREPTVEVAHEALLREWPQLREWMDESRVDVRQQRLLGSAATAWSSTDRDAAYLLRGSRLELFEGWSAMTSVALTAEERHFLAESVAVHQQRVADEEARRQRELEQAQKLAQTERQRAEEQTAANSRLRQRAFLLVGALAIAAVLAVAAFVFGRNATTNANLAATREVQAQTNADLAATREVQAQANADLAATSEADARSQTVIAQENADLAATREAEAVAAQSEALAQARLAFARELSARSVDALSGDAELGMLLAMKSLEIAQTPDGETALHRALQANRIRERKFFKYGFPQLSTIDGSQLMGIYDNDENSLQVWDLANEQPLFSAQDAYWSTRQGDGSHWLVWQCEGDAVLTCTGLIYDIDGNLIPDHPLAASVEFDESVVTIWEVTPDFDYYIRGLVDGTIELDPVASDKELVRLEAHAAPITGYGFNQSGTLLISSDVDGRIILWDLTAAFAGERTPIIADWQTEQASVVSYYETIHEIGDRLIVILWEGDGEATATSVSSWEIVSGDAVLLGQSPEHPTRVRDIAVSQDGEVLATGSSDGAIKIVELATGRELLELTGSRVSVAEVEFIDGAHTLLSIGIGGEIIIWDASSIRHEVSAIAQVPVAIRADVSPDGEFISVGNATGPLSIFNVTTGELAYSIADSVAGTRVARFSDDGSMFASGGYDGIIRLWDVQTGELIREWQAHETAGDTDVGAFWPGIWDLAFSPDGSMLLSGAFFELPKLWDTSSGQLIRTLFQEETSLIWRVAFSPDGQQIAIRSNLSGIRVYQTNDGEELWRSEMPGGIGFSYSHAGHLLAATGQFGSFRVLNALTGEPAYETPSLIGFAQAVEFTADDQLMITSDDDNTSVWDANTGEFLFVLADYPLGELGITEDGRVFTAEFATGNVAEYTLYVDDALALARERATRDMTEQECLQYLRNAACEIAFDN
jgi:serine/threonine protein kinase/WD40 repeat protein/DNA-binding SARP family transcriptional activator